LETQLLATILNSRDSYFLIAHYIRLKQYSREFQIIFKFINDYYIRDPQAQFVERALFGELLSASIQNEKHVERFLKIIDSALAEPVSGENVKALILEAKKKELGQELAMAIANGKEHTELVDEYRKLLQYTSLDELNDTGIEVYTHEDLERVLEDDADPTGRLAVYPLSLNERLDGGMRGSDHMTIYARPELGKTGLILTMAGGFAKQGAKGIIFQNEERITRLITRQVCNLTGMSIHEVRADPRRARELAEENGFSNIKFVAMSPGTLRQIEDYVEREEPKWVILDQLRNIAIKSESRTNQLEAVCTGFREILKRNDTVGISVTQAGDSAEGKAVLEMGDIDYSNTGVQAACDVLLGVGATPEQKQSGIRVMTLTKNKLGSVHDDWPVRFNPLISKYASIKH
jgi:archaellum biogenesis ATPase FlaH